MYPIDTSPDLIVSIQATELSNYAIGLLKMKVAAFDSGDVAAKNEVRW